MTQALIARHLCFLACSVLAVAAPAHARDECGLPPVSADTQIVLLGTYEAHAQSSVALGLQDNEVRAGTIVVATGDHPLALIVSTYDPTIWQFRGAVGRIAWVVATSFNTAPNSGSREDGPPLAGVTGVSADRVRFLPNTDCLRYWDELPRYQSEAIEFVTRALGRAPDVTAYHYSVSGFGVPGGEILDVPFGVNANGLAGEGTVVTIDPASVVASQTPLRYDVLPAGYGLKQLVRSGVLVPLQKTGDYRVTRKFRFPADLYGANSANFWLAKGVPVPDGDPGHSCVLSEETGKPLFGVCH